MGGDGISHFIPAMELWASTMLRASVQGGVLILAVWALCRVAPRIPAHVRCWLWWLASAKLLISLCFAGGVAVPLLPRGTHAPRAAAPIAKLFQPVRPSYDAKPAPAVTPTPATTPITSPVPVGVVAPLPAAPSSWLPLALFAAWAVGSMAMLVWNACGWWRVRDAMRRAETDAPDALREETARIAAQMGYRTEIAVRVSLETGSPFVAGLWRPVLIAPSTFSEKLSEPERRMALAHEIAHLRRFDLALGAVPALARMLLFFHPLAWLAAREYAATREEACDAAAIAATQLDAVQYARLLLKVMANGAAAPSGALGISPAYHAAKRRLLHVARPGWDTSRAHTRLAAAALCGAGMCAALPLHVTARTLAMTHLKPDDMAAPLHYVLQDLGPVGASASIRFAINDRGQVAGARDERALLWDNGHETPIGAIGRYHYGAALAINNSGTVAATYYNYDNYPHTLLWQDGAKSPALPSKYRFNEPHGVNDLGWIVGGIRTGGHDAQGGLMTQAFLRADGQTRMLGTLGGDHSTAYDVNDNGLVVGKADLARTYLERTTHGFTRPTHAFLWRDGVMQDLGTLGGDNSLACAVNQSGQSVGYSATDEGVNHACLWDNEQAVDLGTLPGHDNSEARAINDAGDAVGRSGSDADTTPPRAVLWTSGRVVDLNTVVTNAPQWTLQCADGVNNSGQIVGKGLIGGVPHAFVLTPQAPPQRLPSKH
ncbi:MAG: peptidase family protein [Capsulimonas sp.]|nr:peptidase family protein [Capsulimonas sp.]